MISFVKPTFMLLVFTMLVVEDAQTMPTLTTPGFASGKDWILNQRSGVVRYCCHREYFAEPQSHVCSEKAFLPGNTDYFRHSPLKRGNIVKLTVEHPEGARSQQRGWNRITGETMEDFELFNQTFERRSLLHLGKNRIHFAILQNNEVLTEGEFEVSVSQRVQRCNSAYLGTSVSPDYYRCIRDARICREYFEDFAKCR